MNLTQAKLLSKLRGGSGSYEGNSRRPMAYERQNSADSPTVSPRPGGLSLGSNAGIGGINPPFDAQFNLSFLLRFFTVAATVYTSVLPAAIAASLKNQLPVFVFGKTDFSSGYAKLRNQYALTTWAYGPTCFIYGKDYAQDHFSAPDATVTAVLLPGDAVLTFWATTAGPVNTVAYMVVRMTGGGTYATLLDATSSDSFNAVTMRYTLADTGQVAQYSQQIGIYNLSLFGNFNQGNVDPSAFKTPIQQQVGIVDVPIQQKIVKSVSWAMYVNYTCVDFTWSIFVNGFNKFRQ